MFGRNFSTKQYVVAIFIVFALWSAIATAWYVCGVNNLCAIQAQAKEMTADPASTGILLADTQAPLMEGYDRSGAAGEIFIMLMIAFTLGALLGRILANSGRTETASHMTLPIATEPAPRVGTPMHVSAFTKNIPRPPVITPTPPPKPEFRHAATTPAMRPPIVIAQKSPPTPVIHLGANTPKPAIGPALSASTKTPDLPAPSETRQTGRPKIKFNTSWSNPVRDNKKA